MCIDACPVGALTSGTYRYKTRPWEMNHVATICTHCGDGCKTTLGVRATTDGTEIMRGDNRDKSGINGDFLCNKGRYAFDFANSEERLTKPLVRQPDGVLKPVSWEVALDSSSARSCVSCATPAAASPSASSAATASPTKRPTCCRSLPAPFSAPTTSITTAPQTTSPSPRALAGKGARTASQRDNQNRARHPVLYRRRSLKPEPPHRLECSAPTSASIAPGSTSPTPPRSSCAARPRPSSSSHPSATTPLPAILRRRCLRRQRHLKVATPTSSPAFRDALRAEDSLLILIGSELRGRALEIPHRASASLCPTRSSLLLSDYVNSRGAADMGLLPDMLPGYVPVSEPGAFSEYTGPAKGAALTEPGLDLLETFDAAGRGETLRPLRRRSQPRRALRRRSRPHSGTPSSSCRRCSSPRPRPSPTLSSRPPISTKSPAPSPTATVTCSRCNKAGDRAGVRSDFEMIVRIADKMGRAHPLSSSPSAKVSAPIWARPAAHSPARPTATPSGSPRNNLEPRVSPFDPSRHPRRDPASRPRLRSAPPPIGQRQRSAPLATR